MGQDFFLISNTRGRNETSAKHTGNVKMSYLGFGRVTHFFCRGKQQTQSVVLGEFPATPLHTRARGLPITGIINEPSWSVSPDHIAKLHCTLYVAEAASLGTVPNALAIILGRLVWIADVADRIGRSVG